MEKFILTYQEFLLGNDQINIRVYPENPVISDYICSYRTLSTEQDLLSFVADLILEMTPILFNDFQEMESVPQHLKEGFEL